MSNAPQDIDTLSPQQKRDLLVQLLEKQKKSASSVYPLSHGQRALWFLHQLAPESGVYNEPMTWRIHVRLDVSALERALQILVERHPALRTVYILQDDKPVQKVLEPCSVAFTVTDATTWSQERLNASLVEEVYRAIDLEQGPIFRARLFTCKPDEHLLILVVHHIAIDGWSYMVLLDELHQVYKALKVGQPVMLPDLKMHYRDYVDWQTDMLAGTKGQKLWEYWQQQLAGPLPVLQLPADHPRPAAQTFAGSICAFTLEEQLSQQIKTLAQAKGVTVYTLLLAAFQILLYRYTGQHDILIGSPVNGRSQAAFDGTIGYFVNLVVLRARLGDTLSFASFLKMTHQVVIEALDHQDYPFPLLVDRLQPQRDSSRLPLCDVAFVMEQLNRHTFSLASSEQKAPGVFAEGFTGVHLDLGELDLEFVYVEPRTAKFDLELQIIAAGDTFSGSLHYNTALFERSTVANCARSFQTLLQNILTNPDQSISSLPLLPQEDLWHIVKEWNETSVAYPLDLCLHKLIEQQAERTPDLRAVVFREQALSYRELNRRANQVAHYLRESGIGPEARVGICMERSPEFIVGLLGVWKAGGAYVPLDPTWPRDRLRSMLEDASVQLLLTQQSQLAALPLQHIQIVALDRDWPVIMQRPEHNPASEVTPDNLAYIIYTSGSTGKPKGVMIQHRSVTNYTYALRDRLACAPGWQYALVSTLATDLGNTAIFGALASGGCLHVLPREMIIDGEAFAQYMAQYSVDVLKIAPSHLRSLLATGGKQILPRRALVLGGEAFPRSLLEQIEVMGAHCAIVNLYGPTETTISVLAAEVLPDPLSPSSIDTIPLGRPFANTQAYILDKYLQPVPIGVTGELYIGGAGLARGYCGRSDLTSERFLPNPFGEEAGARLYKTGDLARYRSDGVIEFLGRVDQQIKLHGFRIEPGEIETCLMAHPAIRESVVQLSGDDPADQRLVAYLVTEGQPLSISAVRRWLLERLPDYMIPATFVYLEKLPLNPTGKVDRQALSAPEYTPEYARAQLETPYSLPQTDTEQTIVRIWQDVLHHNEIGMQDNFFELGGNSLLMSEVHHRLRAVLQREITLTTLFRYPSIKSLASFIEQEQQRSSAVEEGAARANNRLARLRQRQQHKLMK